MEETANETLTNKTKYLNKNQKKKKQKQKNKIDNNKTKKRRNWNLYVTVQFKTPLLLIRWK